MEPFTHSPAVAVAASLGPLQRQALTEQGWELHSIRDAPPDCRLVLVRPVSPGALHCLQLSFPYARIVVVDRDPWPEQHEVDRILAAGADCYLRAPTGSRLTALVDKLCPVIRPGALTAA